jgi:uncharacterized repeat protein (TIGR01451 family)
MRNILLWLMILVASSLLLGWTGAAVPAAEDTRWQEKVDPWVFSTASQGETEFLVFLKDQADLSAASALQNKKAKGRYVYETLSAMAKTSQQPIRAALEARGVAYQSFWIVNMLWLRGDLGLIQEIAQRTDVSHIYANPQVRLSLPDPEPAAEILSAEAIEWNILKINANDVWAAGYTGQGVVVGGQDTGYDWDHPALIHQYRGWDDTRTSHDYNWFDATGLSPYTPVDPHGHGTHTMGTMVGDDGGSNQIGVAPGARWIGCRNMDSGGNGTPATYIACYEWFVAPTRTDGTDPRPELAPDVINNSWSCPFSEGCTDPNILLSAVENVRAAGILTAHSAGNNGSSCGTVNQPATIYEASFSVGSTTSTDSISSFSSRGPVTVDGSNRLKPQVTAPGSSIRSCIPGSGYSTLSGTSMAAPHVAGLTALLISASPALAGQVEVLETLIEQSALPLYTTQDCGGDTPTSRPNHTYGWGRIDAWAAYQHIPYSLLVNKTSTETVVPGNMLTYTFTVTNSHPFLNTHNVTLTDIIPQGTSFVSATGNYILSGGTVTWNLGDLNAHASQQVELEIHVPQEISGTITNQTYWTASDEVTTPVWGQPVSTLVHQPALMWGTPTGCQGDWLLPGEFLACPLEIFNMGNYTDTIQLSASSIDADAVLTPSTVTLGIEQSESVTLTVSIPTGAQGGTEIETTASAVSTADPSVTEPLVIINWVYHHFLLPFVPKP